MNLSVLSDHGPSPEPAPWVPFRVLLVDDEPLARQRLRSHLAPHPEFTVVAECGNGREAIPLIRTLRPDVVFLDVEMPGLSGPEIWHGLRIDPAPLLVFATAHRDFALLGFDLHATDYLLKPFNKERFAETLARLRKALNSVRPPLSLPLPPARSDAGLPAHGRLVLKHDGEFHFVRPDEIVRMEAHGDFIKVHTTAGAHLVRRTLSSLQSVLDPALFLRVHRSHLVSREHIVRIAVHQNGDYQVKLSGGVSVPVARGYLEMVRRLLG